MNRSSPHQPDQEGRVFPLIKIVGVSASGKSTLVRGLRAAGYNARPISQEHSNVPDLWEQFDRPEILIFLDLSQEAQRERRPDVSWSPLWYRTELNRLHHARSRADLKIDTTDQAPAEVLELALLYLRHRKIAHDEEALPPLGETGMLRADDPEQTERD